MAQKAKKAADEVSDILKVERGEVIMTLLHTTPLVNNRLSEKVKHELLMPARKKNAVERATTLKHVPIDEFRASIYRTDSPDTLIGFPSLAVKAALRSAALDMPGTKKTEVGRRTSVSGELVSVYGIPRLFMRPVRSADMARTPDIRTRAIVERWACTVRIEFAKPLMTAQAVVNLLAAAGIIIGIGDWRPEKGAGNYGQFEIVAPDDPRVLAIVKAGGREAQEKAMLDAVPYDDESAELLEWFAEESAARKLRGAA